MPPNIQSKFARKDGVAARRYQYLINIDNLPEALDYKIALRDAVRDVSGGNATDQLQQRQQTASSLLSQMEDVTEVDLERLLEQPEANDEFNHAMSRLRDYQITLPSSFSDLQAKNDALQSHVDKLVASERNAREELTQTRADLIAANTLNDKLKTDLDMLANTKTKYKTAFKQKRDEANTIRRNRDDLKASRDQFQANSEELQSTNSTQQSRILVLEGQLKAALDELQDIKTRGSESNQSVLQEINRSLTATSTATTTLLNNQKIEITSLRKRAEDAEQNLINSEAVNARLEEELSVADLQVITGREDAAAAQSYLDQAQLVNLDLESALDDADRDSIKWRGRKLALDTLLTAEKAYSALLRRQVTELTENAELLQRRDNEAQYFIDQLKSALHDADMHCADSEDKGHKLQSELTITREKAACTETEKNIRIFEAERSEASLAEEVSKLKYDFQRLEDDHQRLSDSHGMLEDDYQQLEDDHQLGLLDANAALDAIALESDFKDNAINKLQKAETELSEKNVQLAQQKQNFVNTTKTLKADHKKLEQGVAAAMEFFGRLGDAAGIDKSQTLGQQIDDLEQRVNDWATRVKVYGDWFFKLRIAQISTWR